MSTQEKEIKLDYLLESDLKNGETDSLFFNTYEVIKWHFKNKRVDKAIALNKKNILLMDSLEYSKNSFYRKNFYSLGYILMKNNSLNETLKYFNKVIELNNTDKLAMKSSKFMADIHYKKLNFYLAAEYYENTVKIAKEIKNIDYVTENSLLANVCYKKIKTPQSIDKAITLLNEAILFEKNNYSEDTYYPGFIGALNSLHKHLGSLYIDRVDYDLVNAKKNYDLALKYAKIINDSLRLADIYHDIGNYQRVKGNSSLALNYFNKALGYNPDNSTRTTIHKSKSRYHLEKKEFEKSKIEIQKAINIQIPSINNHYSIATSKHYLFNAPDKFELLDLIINKAVVFTEEAKTLNNEKQNLNKALKIIENADALLDHLRLATNNKNTKLFWKSIFSELYVKATNICFELNDKDKAFYFIEKNKAIILKEDIEQKYRRDLTTIPKHIIVTHDSLRYNIEKYRNVPDSLSNLKLIAKQHFNNFIDTLDNKYKSVFKTIQATQVVGLSDFQNSIKSTNKVYLQYLLENEFLGFSSETVGFGMLITKTEVDFFKIKNIDSLKTTVQTLKNLVNKPLNNKNDKENYNKVSYDIYRNLFPSKIRPKLENKIITIIPDNFLLNIPFEAIQTSTNSDDYLILKNEINYAYSASFLLENNKINRENTKNAIGFAPINFKNDLPDLPHTESELSILNSLISSDIFTYENATKANFENNLKNYKIIHLSTHASANKSALPNIAFYDSSMNLNEIYSTENDAELVVLSACETSFGELKKGEGVMSLARGFFNTGANSVASTLWTVNDKSSSLIIQDFYKNLERGHTKSSALHNAKLNYLKIHSLSEASPYYWASFVLTGDPSAIEFNNNFSMFYRVMGSLTLLIVLILLYKKKKVFFG
nr:CHAT domain-containing protein [uncultured Psychroserpens sp.]